MSMLEKLRCATPLFPGAAVTQPPRRHGQFFPKLVIRAVTRFNVTTLLPIRLPTNRLVQEEAVSPETERHLAPAA
jgi:hypothetical protein